MLRSVVDKDRGTALLTLAPVLGTTMSKILEEPPVDPVRGYFSQQCVLLTGIASGVVEPTAGDALRSPTYLMGRRDGYHVVVAHLACSRTLKEAADKCVAFGRGVEERAGVHPYGPDWSHGFADATLEASSDIALYAATQTLPAIDKARLRAARTAARHVSPLAGAWPAMHPSKPEAEPPKGRREW